MNQLWFVEKGVRRLPPFTLALEHECDCWNCSIVLVRRMQKGQTVELNRQQVDRFIK